MKRTLLVCVLVLACVFGLFAQGSNEKKTVHLLCFHYAHNDVFLISQVKYDRFL